MSVLIDLQAKEVRVSFETPSTAGGIVEQRITGLQYVLARLQRARRDTEAPVQAITAALGLLSLKMDEALAAIKEINEESAAILDGVNSAIDQIRLEINIIGKVASQQNSEQLIHAEHAARVRALETERDAKITAIPKVVRP